ncbi:hypothetical protein BJV77DRAFT_1023443 [Russula vinacea]|nr:hypothetical protein BJV77DRAFT_1023443 [Russula vinacea]
MAPRRSARNHQESQAKARASQRARRSSVYARAAHRAKCTQWALIAQQTSRIVLGDGKYVETRRVPVASTLANASETPQPSSVVPMRTWHMVHDISAQVRHSVLSTAFYPPSHDFPKPMASMDASAFEFSKYPTLSIVRRLYLTSQSSTQAPYRVHNSNIGVLSPLSRRPGSGFLGGSSTYNAVLARSTSLISSLTSTLAHPFFASLRERTRLANPAVAALSTDALLYSPSVVGLRRDDADHFELTDDDFDGELDAIPADPTTKDLETPPAVNAQNQRAMGEYVAPYYMNVLSAAPILAGAFRSTSQTSSEFESDRLLRQAVKSRIAKILRLFAARGDTTLVLGAFGHEEGTPIVMVAQIYAELLACSPNPGDVTDGEFRNVFQKVIFAVPAKLHSSFRNTFEMRIFEDELVRSLESC